MQITEFKISDDKLSLSLVITDAANITSLLLWKEDNYKDFSKSLDLSSKLTGSATENISISLSDLGENYIDGIYFIEAEDDDELSLEITYSLIKYKECILDKLIYTDTENCLSSKNIELINAFSFYRGLELALEERFINEILNFSDILNKYCSKECETCNNDIVTDNTNQDILNPDNIIINLDGGNR